jgi:AbiV family abortive infection protein
VEKSIEDLEVGSKACLINAERLLNDAKTLFYDKASYLSSFLLTQLCLEELSKGFLLSEKASKKEALNEKEWEKFTKGNAHKIKLTYLQEIEANWIKDCLAGDESMNQYLNKEEHWIAQSKMYYNWRMNSLYVDYNFDEKKWIEPSKFLIGGKFSIDEIICMAGLQRAEHLASVLAAKIN